MIRKAIGYTLIIAAIGATIYVRFANPEMTETQLFIEFWYVWLFVVAVVFGGIWMFRKETL